MEKISFQVIMQTILTNADLMVMIMILDVALNREKLERALGKSKRHQLKLYLQQLKKLGLIQEDIKIKLTSLGRVVLYELDLLKAELTIKANAKKVSA